MTKLREIIILLISCVIKHISIVVKITTHELLRTCRVWGIKAEIQVFTREFHIYIHFFFEKHIHIYLNYAKIEFIYCIY